MLSALIFLCVVFLTAVATAVVLFLACWVYISFHPEIADGRPPNSEPH